MSNVVDFSKETSIVNVYVSELRDVKIQTDSMRFRKNLERIAEAIAYEISKTLTYQSIDTETPLGIAPGNVLENQPVIATILRAGMPMHQGVLNIFDRAENAFVSAYRKHHKDDSFTIHIEYLSSPSLEGKTLIIVDPMLASGQSMALTYEALITKRGMPAQTHIIAAIGSEDGLDFCKKKIKGNITYWLGAIDPELNAKSYIVPGLGDAGDLAYGNKI